jgi:hypothetical protein
LLLCFCSDGAKPEQPELLTPHAMRTDLKANSPVPSH